MLHAPTLSHPSTRRSHSGVLLLIASLAVLAFSLGSLTWRAPAVIQVAALQQAVPVARRVAPAPLALHARLLDNPPAALAPPAPPAAAAAANNVLPVPRLIHPEAEAAVMGAARRVIVDRAIVLRYGPAKGSWLFQITPDQLRKAALTRASGAVVLDQSKLLGYLQPVAAALHAPPQNARLDFSQGSATLVPDQSGADLDLNAAVAAIVSAAAGSSNRVVTLPVKPVDAKVKAAALRTVQAAAQAALDRGFVLHYAGSDYPLRSVTVGRFLAVVPGATAGAPATLDIAHDALLDTLDLVAQQVNTPTRDPLYRLVDNQVVVAVAPRLGHKLDYAATAAAIEAAFAAGQNEADLVVTDRPPSIALPDVANIQTPALIGRASTSFSGSSSARAFNVRFGAGLLDGMLIPPGAIFSMDEALGPLTVARGFRVGFGITRDGDGNLTTVPAEAGGICQVATTFFQASYWLGLPIVERHNHSYWIPRYGQGVTGRKGLDATIAPPDADLRVQNTTGNWIRVHAYSNGETVLFELYGTNPGWTVQVSDPVIKRVVSTSDQIFYDSSAMLPAGQRVQAEHRQNGFDASITRRVLDGSGAVLDTVTLTSRYEPAHDRWVVGTGKMVPAP